jgi:hypothetical protein
MLKVILSSVILVNVAAPPLAQAKECSSHWFLIDGTFLNEKKKIRQRKEMDRGQ